MSKKQVLAIDGGGIRGIIPATILAELERITGKRIFQLFDLIAGTSTGGILALALTRPSPANKKKAAYKASDLIDFYIANGPHIFATNIWHQICGSVADAFGPRYPAKQLESALWTYFGDTRLSQALTPTLIPSYDLRGVVVHPNGTVDLNQGGQPVFFSSEKAKADPAHFDFFMKHIARATSAAPSYFAPARIQPAIGGDWMEMVDGGVFANNPAMCAYTEALKILKPNPKDKDAMDISVISIGTGELTLKMDLNAAESFGELQWIKPTLDVMMSGASKTVDHQLQTVLPYAEDGACNPDARYFRLQFPLTQEHSEMSDASDANMEALHALAQDYVLKNAQTMQAIAALVS
jgi:patatin-like phospholipase/acyl hydrolase